MHALLELLYPQFCLLCRHRSHRALPLCVACEKTLPWLSVDHCPRCALPMSAPHPDRICGKCLQNKPFFDETLCAFSYEYPLDHWITDLKFRKSLPRCTVLAHGLMQVITQSKSKWPDCLVPVPLHRSRLRERGFNQSLEIARLLAKRLNLKIQHDLCTRVQATAAQSSLPQEKRLKNIADAFVFHPPRTLPLHVAIVDDVMTTGSTVNELAKALKTAGVQRVSVWCAARVVMTE